MKAFKHNTVGFTEHSPIEPLALVSLSMAEMSCFLSSTVFLRANAGFSRPHLGALLVLGVHEGGEESSVFVFGH